MKLLRFLTASFLTLSVVGCCCGRSVVSDPCDPCGGIVAPTFGSLRPWRSVGHGWNRACDSCSSCGCGCGGDVMMDSGCSGGGGGCAGGSCGAPPSSLFGSTSGGGCACGQPNSTYQYPTMMAPSNPTPSQPAYTPERAAPPSPMTTPDPPAVPGSSEPAAMLPPVTGNGSQPQMVSYEEFQRMPGTIISGPGAMPPATSNSLSTPIQQTSAKAAPFLAPPPPAAKTVTPPATAARNGQPVWVPAKPY